METHPPNILTPPQPKKPRPSAPNDNDVLPSSMGAEGMVVNQTVPTSSAPSTAPPPGSVPQRTPQQVAPQGASPLPVNQVKSAANITGQPMQPMGGAPQQPSPPPPAAASGTGKEVSPQGTQQQSQSFAQLLSMTRNDGEMGVLQGNGGIPPRTSIDDRLPPSSSSNPPSPSGGGGGGGSSSVTPDQEKTKLIQQQLVLLLHAHKCLQKERESESYRCSLPHCQVMKEVFRHIMQCTKTRDCSYPHCASSRQIIQHWKSCGRQDCSVCMPVKGVIKLPGPIAQAGGGATVGGEAGQCPPPREHWQSSVLQDGEMGVLQGNGGIPPRTGIDDRLPPSSSSNPPPPGGGGGGGSSSVTPDQERTKLIQQQLVLLLHAHKCLQRERESESYRCSLPHCQVMKEVFRHIMQCTKTRDCSYPHCASSRQIIQHWKSCGQQDCSICMPVKGVIKPPGTIAQAGGGATAGGAGGQVDGNFAGPVSSAPAMQALAGQPPPPGEHWQSSVRQDVRDYLIKKILNGIYPVHDYNSAMTNPQYLKLVQFIQRVEDNFFRTCTSKDEYFAKLADKYQHLMKELHRTYPGPGEVKPMVPPTPTPVSQPMYQQRPAVPMPTSSNPGSVPPTRSVDSGLSQLYKEVDETLHTQGEEWFLYTCNMCQQPVETCYHCSECEDFDLCVCCYEKNGHAHSMTRLGMDLGIHDEGAGPKDPKEALNQAIQRFIQVLMHAAQCRDRTCKSPSCAKMKRIMHHVMRCKQCVVCKQFLNLCLQHAKTCKSSNCPVPLCANIKKHLQEKQRQASFQESRFAARRMLAMRSAMPMSSSSVSSSNASTKAAVAIQSSTPSTRQQPGTPQQSPSVGKLTSSLHSSNATNQSSLHKHQSSTPIPEDSCHNVIPSQEAGPATLAEVDETLNDREL